jgi:Domain of unknown function (DUF4412)
MKMTMRTYFRLSLMALTLLLSMRVAAQTAPLSDCKIDYKIDMSDPNMDPMAKMMMGSAKMSIGFLGAKSRVEMNMNVMMKTVAISDETTKKSIVLMDMLGQKKAMVPDDNPAEIKDRYDATSTKTGKTKTIAGYKCSEYIVKTKEGDQLQMWCTPAIKPKSSATDFSFKNVDGFPLQMEIDQDGMKIKMVATKVSAEKMDAKLFSTAVPAGYTLTTQEKMMEDFGGAGK